MFDPKQPIYTLNVEQFQKLLQDTVHNGVEKLLEYHKQEPGEQQNDIINVDEAAELLQLKKSTIYTKVSRLEIPVLSKSKPLLFSRKQLMEWLAKGKPLVAEMDLEEWMRERG